MLVFFLLTTLVIGTGHGVEFEKLFTYISRNNGLDPAGALVSFNKDETGDCSFCFELWSRLRQSCCTYFPYNLFDDGQHLEKYLSDTNDLSLAIFLRDSDLTSVQSQELWNLQTSKRLKDHSWVVIMRPHNNDSSTVIVDYLRKMDLESKLQLNSQLYFLLQGCCLVEVYKNSFASPVRIETVFNFDSGAGKNVQIWKRRNDLGGIRLKVAASMIEPDFFEIKEARNPALKSLENDIDGSTFSGPYAALLVNLMENLNFTVSLNYPEDGYTYGTLNTTTGEWSGVIGLVVNKEADFSIVGVSLTETRSHFIDICPTTLSINRLYMRKPLRSLSWNTYIQVFDGWYMLALFGTMSLCAFTWVFCFLSGTWKSRLGRSWALVMLASTALDAGLVLFSMRKTSVKIAFFTICLFGALNIYSYGAGLTSSLTYEVYEMPINKLRDLIDNPGYQIILMKGSSDEMYFTEATMETNPNAKRVYDQMIKNNPNAFYEQFSESESMLLHDTKMVLFCNQDIVANVFAAYPCHITKAKSEYAKSVVGLPFPKDSQYLQLFNHKIAAMNQEGILDRMWLHNKNNKPLVSCTEDEFKPFTYHNIVSAFALLLIGISVALIWLTVEHCIEKIII